jgi:predicted hydrolase (HD superfamily)
MLAGAEDLGVPFDELIAEVVGALSAVADRLGLAGPTA